MYLKRNFVYKALGGEFLLRLKVTLEHRNHFKVNILFITMQKNYSKKSLERIFDVEPILRESEKREVELKLLRLERVAEYYFLRGLESDIVPQVMGSLPDPVEFERTLCLKAGISEEAVDNIINSTWYIAHSIYECTRKY